MKLTMAKVQELYAVAESAKVRRQIKPLVPTAEQSKIAVVLLQTSKSERDRPREAVI
jgi:hypothetical protein